MGQNSGNEIFSLPFSVRRHAEDGYNGGSDILNANSGKFTLSQKAGTAGHKWDDHIFRNINTVYIPVPTVICCKNHLIRFRQHGTDFFRHVPASIYRTHICI